MPIRELYNIEESEDIQLNLAKSHPVFPPSNVDDTIEAVILKATQMIDDQEVATVATESTDTQISEQEQLWCTCKNVASGEMIACDSGKCTVEWFHFQCVNIIRAPRGKWFCQACSGGSTKRKLTFEDSNATEKIRRVDKINCPDCGKHLSASYLRTHMKKFCTK